eukprot:428413-Ditylum_brightwellii.AAC.1
MRAVVARLGDGGMIEDDDGAALAYMEGGAPGAAMVDGSAEGTVEDVIGLGDEPTEAVLILEFDDTFR